MTALARFGWRAGSVAVALAIFGLWALVVRAGLVSRVFLPSPADAFGRVIEGFTTGNLFAMTLATAERMAIGWFVASLVGAAIGALVGSSRTASALLVPTLELLRPLPSATLLPIVIALVGIRPGILLVVIAFGSVWPVLLAAVHGFRSVEPRLREVAGILGFSRLAFAFRFGLPHALPDIIAGMRISLTAALIVTVVGEMLTSQPGLGTTIMLAARRFQAPELYAGVILLGVLGFINNTILGAAEFYFLPWRRPTA